MIKKLKLEKINTSLIAIIIIFIICMRYFSDLKYPIVLNDEFGYWANAVSLAGYDWTSLVAQTPYYSWGYSLLLLPVVCIFPAEYWYKVGIVLNIIMLCISYVYCCKFGQRLFPKCKENIIKFISLVVIIFPSNIIYAQETWSETLLYLLMWIIAFLFIELEYKFSWIRFVLINVALGYMYIVHARTIGVIAITILFEVLLLLKHKKKVIFALGSVIVFLLLYLINNEMKQFMINNFYSASTASQLNNVGLDSGTITKYFNIISEYWKDIMYSFGYKFVYIIIATGMTIFTAVYYVGNEAIKCVSKKIYESGLITKIWSIMSVFVSVAICALQMYSFSTRKDIVTYSRYFENVMGPILIIALVYTYYNGKVIRGVVVVAEIILMSTVPKMVNIIIESKDFFNSICTPVMGAFYDNVIDKGKLDEIILFSCITLGTILILINFSKKKSALLPIVAIGIFFIIIGDKGSKYVLEHREKMDQTILAMESIIEKKYSDEKIVYVKNNELDPYSVWPKYLQFLIPDNKIEVIEDIRGNREQLVLVFNTDIDNKCILEKRKYILISQGKAMSLYKKNTFY